MRNHNSIERSRTHVGDGPQSFSLDVFAGYSFRDKPILGIDGVINQIDSGTKLTTSNKTISYTFLDKTHLVGVFNNPNFGFTAGTGVTPFSAQQREIARESITLWDDLIAPRFVEKHGVGADIVMANSADPAQAYAYYPGNGAKYQSDVFIADPSLNGTNNWFTPGGYGTTTLIHELGHSIGLSHPGAYNYDPNVTQDYAGLAEYAQDSEQYSIMSYWTGEETGNLSYNWTEFQFNNAQTPMLHDILTIQSIYGADLTTRTGATTYGFNSNTGRDVYDFGKNPYPYLSIYDAGGTDTIDLSGFKAGNFLDLHAGSFSSVGQAIPTLAAINIARDALSDAINIPLTPRTQAQVDARAAEFQNYAESSIAADTGVSGVRATEYSNLSIAYGTVIENGTGGSARDVLWGNEVANVLKGNGGNDVLNGYEGADQLYGGAGADVFEFSNVEKGDWIRDFKSGQDKIDLTGLGVDFSFLANSAFTRHAGELRSANGYLSGDINGDGITDLSIRVSDTVHLSDLIII